MTQQGIQIVHASEAPRFGRVNRYPKHSFNLAFRPYQIQPFMIAPVLPGETMKNALMQTRCVTDPIKNPLIGWWFEQYLFYVKLRDLNDRDSITPIFIDSTQNLSALNSAADAATYHAGGAPNFTDMCLDRVTDEYFRDEGEAIADAVTGLDGLPMASVFAPGQNNYLDSLSNDTITQADEYLPGEGHDDTNIVAGFSEHYEQWEAMRAMKLTDVSYDDYLKTYGIRAPQIEEKEDEHKPELLRYVRDWSYPSNTIDPLTGTPSSAVSWSIAERADKARFFTEPGFIFGVAVARPKVYFDKMVGSAAHFMTDAFSWMPALLAKEAYTSLKEFATNTGPIAQATQPGYWLDMRDLLLYGDQFVNQDPSTAGNINHVDLPDLTLNKRFTKTAEIDNFFSGTSKKVRCDGVVNLTIAGKQVDLT